MVKNIGGEGRILRVCDLCGGVDDHPRHTIAGDASPPNADTVQKVKAAGLSADDYALALEQLYEPGEYRHMDCCREAGCPDGTCDLVTSGAEDKRGKQLLDHLTALHELATETDEIVKGAAE